MGNILSDCKPEKNKKELEFKKDINSNFYKFNNSNTKTESTIAKSNKAKNKKEEQAFEDIMNEDLDNNKSNDFDIGSKVKNIDNNLELDDIETNLNINNNNKFICYFDNDKDCNIDDYKDINDFEMHEIKEGKNDVNESFISLDLMNKDENAKYNLDIIWIDEKINNSENKNYLEKMKNDYPNIKINVYDNLEEGFNEILNLEFVSTFVIVSGRLYSQYYQKLKENLVKIKCIPINLIFTSSNLSSKKY